MVFRIVTIFCPRSSPGTDRAAVTADSRRISPPVAAVTAAETAVA